MYLRPYIYIYIYAPFHSIYNLSCGAHLTEPGSTKSTIAGSRRPKKPMAEEADEAPKVQRGGSCGKVGFFPWWIQGRVLYIYGLNKCLYRDCYWSSHSNSKISDSLGIHSYSQMMSGMSKHLQNEYSWGSITILRRWLDPQGRKTWVVGVIIFWAIIVTL